MSKALEIIAPLFAFRAVSSGEKAFPQRIDLEGGYTVKKFDTRVLDIPSPALDTFLSKAEREDLKNTDYAISFSQEIEGSRETTILKAQRIVSRITHTLRVCGRTRAVTFFLPFQREGEVLKPLPYISKPVPQNIHLPASEDDEHWFASGDAPQLKQFWRGVRFLWDNYFGEYHRVLNALIIFELAHYSPEFGPWLTNIVTSLESLFNTSKEQVGYTLRLRCSHFLERDATRRLNLFRMLKEIYDLRSAFVHGQKAEGRKFDDSRHTGDLLAESERICRRCFQKILSNIELIKLFENRKQLVEQFELLEIGMPTILTESEKTGASGED